MSDAEFSNYRIFRANRVDGPSIIFRGSFSIEKIWGKNYTFMEGHDWHRTDGYANITKTIEIINLAWFHRDKWVDADLFETYGVDPMDMTDEEILMMQIHIDTMVED